MGTSLTSDLDYWEVTLKTGGVLTIRAHGVKESGERLIFVALMEGEPAYEYEIANVPTAAVSEWQGGWADPRFAKTPI